MAEIIDCKANELVAPVKILNGELAALIQLTKMVDEKVEKMTTVFENIYKVVAHLHDSHAHPFPHEQSEKYDVEPGSPVYKDTKGPADRLLAEYNNNMDFDMNGLIFGYDFMIDPEDERCPVLIKDIQRVFCQEKQESLYRMTFNDYILTLPEEYRKYCE